MNDQVETLNQGKATLIDLAVRFGPKVFVAVAILLVGQRVGRWVGRVMLRELTKFDLAPPGAQPAGADYSEVGNLCDTLPSPS